MISFQQKACRAVRKIPKGKFLSYKQVAEMIGHPRAYRAVGNILSKNRDKKIPCHRVIKSDGRIGGYNQGVDKKTFLLQKEGLTIRKGKITLK